MDFAADFFDIWVFRRRAQSVEFLLLHTSVEKAARFFNGGRFWQIPSERIAAGETMVGALRRSLGQFGLFPRTLWAGEHAYLIYNRRFEQMMAIAVFAAEVEDPDVILAPEEHSDFEWCSFETALARVHFRGLKDGLRSVHEYVTGVDSPARELCLYETLR
jgi:hypothetical protein